METDKQALQLMTELRTLQLALTCKCSFMPNLFSGKPEIPTFLLEYLAFTNHYNEQCSQDCNLLPLYKSSNGKH